MRLIFYILSFFGMTAEASSKSVLFFGGHGSTASQLQDWQQGLEKKPDLSSEFTFRGIPYPSKSYKKDSAIRDGETQIQSLIKEINANPDREYILVAHSSGSALAIEIAKQIKTPKNLNLVILDGFSPDLDLQKKVKTKCWTAQSASDEKLQSINYKGMLSCQSHEILKPYNCNNQMCLHFSLVNLNAAAENIQAKNYKENGYKGLSHNTVWLKEFMNTSSSKVIQNSGAK